jgi:hypothetical protein
MVQLIRTGLILQNLSGIWMPVPLEIDCLNTQLVVRYPDGHFIALKTGLVLLITVIVLSLLTRTQN